MTNYKTKWMPVTRAYTVTDEQFQQVEEQLGCHFPTNFKSYIKRYHGHYADSCSKIHFKNLEGEVIGTGLARLHSFDSQNEYGEYIVEMNQHLAIATKPDNLISFGDDGAGGFFCFDTSDNDEYPVVIWFNGYKSHTYFFLASSFDALMLSLEC